MANKYLAEDSLLELEALTACMHNWIEGIKKSHSIEGNVHELADS